MADVSLLAKWQELPPVKKEDLYDTMDNADLRFIDPAFTAMDSLEKAWEDFMNMTKPFRRRSDWIMLDILGCTNEDLYNEMKSNFLGDNLYGSDLVTPDDMLSEAAFIPAADNINYAQVLAPIVEDPDFALKVKEANEWMLATGFVVIVPIVKDPYGNSAKRDVEAKWDYYNMLIKKHRRVSDWKSQELFGLTVPQIYTYLMSIYNKEDIEAIEPSEIEDESPFSYNAFLKNYCCNTLMDESYKDFGETMVKLTRPTGNYLESIHANIISDAISKFGANNAISVDINYTDLPCFSPEEMIDMGIHSHAPEDNFYGVDGEVLMPGNEMLEWFELYEATFNGMPSTERFEELNRKRNQVLDLVYSTRSNELFNINEQNHSLMQGIIELGWNPVISRNPKTKVLVDKNMRGRIGYYFGESKVIDLCGFEPLDIPNQPIFENSSEGTLKPIYICFEEGPTLFSKAIKGYTHGLYSHAAIAFDSMMDKFYSYGVDYTVEKKGIRGGITRENIRDKDPEKHFGIYVVFVTEEIFNRIKTNVEHFVKNAKNTAYSYANVLSIVFKIPIERDNKLICSQFVDRMLKLGGIDITKKKSSLVDPNYLRDVSKANKSIYKVFEGKIKSFNAKTIQRRVDTLLNSKAKAFTGTMSEFALRENSCYFSSSIEVLAELSSGITSDSPLFPIFESVYKPCFEVRGIEIQKEDHMNTLDTVEKGYTLIKNYNESGDESLFNELKELRQLIAREMVYVIRPAIYEPLKECKLAIDDVIQAKSE